MFAHSNFKSKVPRMFCLRRIFVVFILIQYTRHGWFPFNCMVNDQVWTSQFVLPVYILTEYGDVHVLQRGYTVAVGYVGFLWYAQFSLNVTLSFFSYKNKARHVNDQKWVLTEYMDAMLFKMVTPPLLLDGLVKRPCWFSQLRAYQSQCRLVFFLSTWKSDGCVEWYLKGTKQIMNAKKG